MSYLFVLKFYQKEHNFSHEHRSSNTTYLRNIIKLMRGNLQPGNYFLSVFPICWRQVSVQRAARLNTCCLEAPGRFEYHSRTFSILKLTQNPLLGFPCSWGSRGRSLGQLSKFLSKELQRTRHRSWYSNVIGKQSKVFYFSIIFLSSPGDLGISVV